MKNMAYVGDFDFEGDVAARLTVKIVIACLGVLWILFGVYTVYFAPNRKPPSLLPAPHPLPLRHTSHHTRKQTSYQETVSYTK